MNPVTAQWHNADESPNDFLLMRFYDNGDVTGERCVNGVYLGEVDLRGESIAHRPVLAVV